MAYEQKDNSGSLFKNDRKETDTHPDYKGTALLNGVEHWVDAWINEKRDGSGKYLAFKVKPKDAQPAQSRVPSRGYSPAPAFDDSDEIPF